MSTRTMLQTIPLSPWPHHNQRLAVVGVGALGSEVCRLLIERGQKHVLLIDPDHVDSRNLALSALFQQAARTDAIVGRAKADLVAKYASRMQGHATWQARCIEIADVGWSELRACDLIISCTDSTLARVETAFVARSLGLPMLDAGVRSHGLAEGRVTWFPPTPASACYLCGLSESRRAEVLAYALSPSLGCTLPPEHQAMSGTADAVRAVASALLSRWNQFQQNTSSLAHIVRLPLSPQHEEILLTRSPTCPWHDLPSPRQLVTLQPDEIFETALQRLGLSENEALDLPWPICLTARCTACGLTSSPMRRTAYVRRRAVCPHCAATGTLDPLACIETIRPGHPARKWTARQLGFLETHLYRVRPLIRLEGWSPPPPPGQTESAEVL